MSSVQESIDLVGERVIIRDNNYHSKCLTGVVITWGSLGAGPKVPIVKLDEGGEEIYILGLLLPYSKKLLDFLNSMSNKEAWNLVCDLYVCYSIQVRNRIRNS